MYHTLAYAVVDGIAIVFVGILYFVLSLIFGLAVQKVDNHVLSRIPNLFLSLISMIVVIQITVALIRRIVKSIKFPLDQYSFNDTQKYEYSKLADLNGGVVIAFTVVTMQPGVVDRLTTVGGTLFPDT